MATLSGQFMHQTKVFVFNSIANVAHFDEENGKPLCDQCCLQKKKGSYCPLCEGCYDDNDYEARMMECATCGGWIHAKCEGVDAEKYQILSHLPNTIDYVCKYVPFFSLQ